MRLSFIALTAAFFLATPGIAASPFYKEIFTSPAGLDSASDLSGLPITVCNRLLASRAAPTLTFGRLPILKGGLGLRGIVGPDPSRFFSHPAKTKFLTALDSLTSFETLAKTMRTSIGEHKSVKLVWHRPRNGPPQLYFLNTEEFPYHYFFAQKVLGFNADVDVFNQNYNGTGDEREFVLATLTLDPNLKNRLLLELFNGDSLNAHWIRELYKNVQSLMAFDCNLFFHPTADAQEQNVLNPPVGIPVVTTKEIYGDRTYFPLNESVAVGYMRFVDPDDENPLLDHTMIGNFVRVPNNVGMLAGVITEEIQTPLSHVNVKCIGRKNEAAGYNGTANMSLVNAREILKKYDGQCVELTVGPNGYQIIPIAEKDADWRIREFWKGKRPKFEGKVESITQHEHQGKLINLRDYYRDFPTPEQHRRLILMTGAKAANLALLNFATRGLDGIGLTSPATMGIPFTFHDDFMQIASGDVALQERLLKVLNQGDLLNAGIEHPISKAHPYLEKARHLIQNGTVPDELVAQLKIEILQRPSSPLHCARNPILLFRSATNSEDLKGFTGAGLYNSRMVRLWNFEKGIAKLRKWEEIEKDIRSAIGYIYSSIWNDRAYQEREWFGITGAMHLDVKAGIAVHGGFSNTLYDGEAKELANGVAITGNIYAPDELEKIYISAQFDDLPITNPPSNAELAQRGIHLSGPYLSEELLFTTMLAEEQQNNDPNSWQQWPLERLRNSSIREGSVFKNPQEARTLAVGLKQVKYAMSRAYGLPFMGLMADVEWNIMGVPGGNRRQISLNQARIFGMSKDR